MSGMSKTQKKRMSYNYRAAYFRKNPGIRTFLPPPRDRMWFCSQCHKPLLGKKNVQVDHIWALGAGGINRTINTAAICPKCNLKKSDKTGLWLINGEIGKVMEVCLFTCQRVFEDIGSLLLAPIRNGPILQRVLMLFVYICLIYFLVNGGLRNVTFN